MTLLQAVVPAADACVQLCNAMGARFGGGTVQTICTLALAVFVWWQTRKQTATLAPKIEAATAQAASAHAQVTQLKASLAPPPVVGNPPASSGSSGLYPPIRASTPDPSMLTGEVQLPKPAIVPKETP